METSGIEPLVVVNDIFQVFFTRFRESVVRRKKGWSEGARVHHKIINALRKGELLAAETLLRQHLEVHQESDPRQE
jgi:DNA-binding GntR family transcriptional regulator